MKRKFHVRCESGEKVEITSKSYLSIYNFDKGTTHLIMPYKYALEMVCDYLGAGNAYSGDKFSLQGELAWWENKKKNDIAMSPAIFHFVDILMKTMAKENSTDVLKRKRSYKLYKVCVRNYKHLS